ncbi:MAG: hypothetical protein FJ224_05185 [Lentisphaerae bacterium]|nr:hypothetical protein [Lentisphaerota bacterium]
MRDTTIRQIPPTDAAGSRLSLNGDWRVQRWPFPTDEVRLAAPATDDTAWESVAQPGKVFYADPEAHNRDIPNWDRVTLTHIDPEDGAVMRRRVTIPADWDGKRIILRFDAVFPAGRFYLDGHCLGEHMCGVTPVEFDVTDRVHAGKEAVVAVRLIRRHRFVQMDMVRHSLEFGGLSQPAELFAVEPCHIVEDHLLTALAADLVTGTVSGTVTVANTGANAVPAQVSVALIDSAGNAVAKAAAQTKVAVGAEASLSLSLTLASPQLWNDEYPNLYTVRITLNAGAQPAQTMSYRTGFRRLDLSPKGPRLNGNPVKFRGVNHLTFHPEHGLYTPREWLRQNLTMMKRCNVNMIRTHYTGPRCLSELCDEMGIYLLQELAIDWGTNYIHDPEWMPPAWLRIEGAVRRDRHHPSLMIWTVGNENMPNTKAVAEAGWNHLRQFDALVKRIDPSRPTVFPPPGPANKIEGNLELQLGDIADTHYVFGNVKRFLAEGKIENANSWEADMVVHTREWALERGWSGCWMSTEYGLFNGMTDLHHSPHASIIDDVPEVLPSDKSTFVVFEERLRREWGFMRGEPTCLGGAFFPWLSSGAGRADVGNPWGWVRWGEDCDWGVITADLLPKPFFWIMRVLFSPVWFPERITWNPGDTELSFTVENQYNAIDLAECTLRVQQGGGGTWMTCLRNFTDIKVNCAPGARAEVRVPLQPHVLKSLESGGYGLCRFTLLDPTGYRPIAAEALIVRAEGKVGKIETAMTIGPDAVLAP